MALAETVGVGIVGNGYVNIPAEESHAATAYTTMATPDEVLGVVVPEPGWLLLGYQALVKASEISAKAAIFLNQNQLKADEANQQAPQVQETGVTDPDLYFRLVAGLAGLQASTSVAGGKTSDVTTGQLMGAVVFGGVWLGSFAAIFAESGVYDISIRFKRGTSGTVTVKERKLWVATMNFATTAPLDV